jgi:hypothetical protein
VRGSSAHYKSGLIDSHTRICYSLIVCVVQGLDSVRYCDRYDTEHNTWHELPRMQAVRRRSAATACVHDVVKTVS